MTEPVGNAEKPLALPLDAMARVLGNAVVRPPSPAWRLKAQYVALWHHGLRRSLARLFARAGRVRYAWRPAGTRTGGSGVRSRRSPARTNRRRDYVRRVRKTPRAPRVSADRQNIQNNDEARNAVLPLNQIE